jgi:hypothetical protein
MGVTDLVEETQYLLGEVSSTGRELLDSLKRSRQAPRSLWDDLLDPAWVSQNARNHFRGSVMLRIDDIRVQGEYSLIEPVLLRRPGLSAPLYGYQLRSRRIYDLSVTSRRLIKLGEAAPHAALSYEFRSSLADFEVSRNSFYFTGNYRLEQLWLSPKREKLGPVLLEWEGARRTSMGTVYTDPVADKVLPLRIPVAVSSHFWSRERLVDAIGGVASLAAATFCFWLAWHIASSNPGGDATKGTSQILSAVGAFLAGLFAAFLRSFIRGAAAQLDAG